MNITPITSRKPVDGLSPELLPPQLVGRDEHLQCGACGFSGQPKHYVFTDGPLCFEPVCNCPLPATLTA